MKLLMGAHGMRNRIVGNKNYQISHAIQVIAISFISLSPLICFILMLMNISRDVDLTEQTARAGKAIVTQENIIKSFMEYSRRVNNEDIMVAVDKVHKDHEESIATLKESAGLLQDIAQREREMMFAAVIIMIAHVGLLFIFFINKADNDIGNIFFMPRYCKYLPAGKKHSERRMWCDNECDR
jgi:hypothetical protein